MSLRCRSILLLLTVVFLPGAAPAQDAFVASLDGAQVDPPTGSPATGSTDMSLVGDILTVNFTFSGLITPDTASHIHCCIAPPGNTAVAIPYFGFPVGVTSGTYSHLFDLTSAATYTTAFITAHGGTTAGAEAALLAGMRSGQAYACVHTPTFPGSEIRAFLVPVLFRDGFESGDTLAWSVTVP